MHKYFILTLTAIIVSFVFTVISYSQMNHPKDDDFLPVLLEDMEWSAYQPAGFGPGLMISIVYGDPSVEDEPYVIRASFPDGYIIPPHIHPRAENLTMLSGKLLMGKGKRFEETKLESYKAGDFLYIPGEHPHFGRTVGPTVFQLHGIGPFQTIVIEDIVGER